MVSLKHFTFPSVVKDVEVMGYLWEPETRPPKALICISHGMTESMIRYDSFATTMAGRGYVVCGKDHLGHGKTAQSPQELGYFGPLSAHNLQNQDFHTLVEHMHERYPGIPLFLMGHSMGSFLTRQYIVDYPQGFDGVILSGPGDMAPLVVSFGRALVDILTLVHGKTYRSHFVQNLMFGRYNSHIKPCRTNFDWLTRDDAVVDEYVRCKENGFVFTLNGFAHLLANIAWVSQKDAFTNAPQNIPILLIGGSEDPVGEWGKALPRLQKKYRLAGVKDVEMHLFEGDRHEVINELNRDVVIDDILAWLEKHTNER